MINTIGHGLFTVTQLAQSGATRSWQIDFAAQLGDQPQLEAFTDTDRSQNVTGFTGTVRNIDSVTYSSGVNLMIGSNTDLNSAFNSFKDLLTQSGSFGDFVDSFFGGGLQAGNDTFTVGGNLLNQAKDWLISQNATASSLQETLNDDYPFVNNLVESVLGPWFGGTVAPGAHLLAGLTGGDTYKFEGVWGAAAVCRVAGCQRRWGNRFLKDTTRLISPASLRT